MSELIAAHHVDALFDPAELAAGAQLGIDAYEPDRPGARRRDSCAPSPTRRSNASAARSPTGTRAPATSRTWWKPASPMIAYSLDPFTYYIPPELSGALTEDGLVTAVGLLLEIVNPAGSRCTVAEPPCRMEVVLAVAEGSAYEAGVRPADVIEAIDGIPTEGMTLVEAAALLDGGEGSEVTLTVERPDGSIEEILVERRPPEVPTLVAEQVGDVGYIRLPDFNPDIPEFIHSPWRSGETPTLVLDLRDNPGGYVDVATLVASSSCPTDR